MNIAQLYTRYIASSGVCTDTRKLTPNCIFFALKGANFDANAFAAQALEQGASTVVVDDASVVTDDRYFYVEDTLVALQKLANHHRHQLGIPIIAITGTNGKTTTKELVSAVLRKKYTIFSTVGNLNNHIGVPLTLLSMNKSIEMGVVEMGANHIGDIEELCNIADPDYGIITNVGRAHLEGFGSFEGVVRTKSELYFHLLKKKGKIFVNGTNEHLTRMASRFTDPIFYLGSNAFYTCTLVDASPYILFKAENGDEVTTNIIGTYNFENIAAALTIGKFFEVPSELANAAIAEYVSENNRSQVMKRGSNTILLDAYNANPTSMTAAISNMSLMTATNKIAILGDMFELGSESQAAHAEIVALAKNSSIDQVLFCGKAFALVEEKNSKLRFFETKSDMVEYLKTQSIHSSIILLKGSRGMKLEEILEDSSIL